MTLLQDLGAHWHYRAKDQAGGHGSSITSLVDATGNGYNSVSVAGTTVDTSDTTLVGKSIRPQGLIQLADPTSFLTHPASGLLGKVATSQNYNASYNGDQLVNGLITGTGHWGWASGSLPTVAAPHWALFGPFSPGRVVKSYSIRPYQASHSRAPKDWKWQGSNNPDGPWTDIHVVSGANMTTLKFHRFTTNNTTAYAYYRLLITACASGTTDMVHISEIMLDEIQNGGDASAELWMVFKAGPQGGKAWRFGTSNGDNYWTWNDTTIYTDFGQVTRRTFNVTGGYTLLSGGWRVIRMRTTHTGLSYDWIDNVKRTDVINAILDWSTSPVLWMDTTRHCLIAEVALTPELTDLEAAYLYNYFNVEHGLSIPGALDPSDPPPAGPAQTYKGNPPTSTGSGSTTGPITIGCEFSVTEAHHHLLGLRWYQPHTGWVGTPSGVLFEVGTAEPISEEIFIPPVEANGAWAEALFPEPIPLIPDKKYRTGIFFPNTRPIHIGTMVALNNGPLVVPNSAGSVNGNHTYAASSPISNPTFSISGNYMVDLIVGTLEGENPLKIAYWGILQSYN